MPNRTAAAAFAPLVVGAAKANGIAPALLAGLVDHESNWNPRAIRQEVRLRDASRGLGQILLKTAQDLGYTGDADGLFDPATNLHYTAKYLALKIQQAGTVKGGISAYNGGYRPSKGFGAPSPVAYQAVLARSQSTGQPSLTRDVLVGEFANQPYVDTIMSNARNFAALASFNANASTVPLQAVTSAAAPAPLEAVLAPTPKPAPIPVKAASLGVGTAAAIGTGIAVIVWLIKRFAHQ